MLQIWKLLSQSQGFGVREIKSMIYQRFDLEQNNCFLSLDFSYLWNECQRMYLTEIL